MLRKTIKYVDLNDQPHEEDFYFHLSKDQIIEMMVSKKGGLDEWLKTMMASQEYAEVYAAFKNIIAASYGIRPEGTNDFEHDEAATKKFMSPPSPALDALLTELMTDEKAALEFIAAVVPRDLSAAVREGKTIAREAKLSEEPEEKPWAHREPTARELREMSREDLMEVYKRRTTQGPISQE